VGTNISCDLYCNFVFGIQNVHFSSAIIHLVIRTSTIRKKDYKMQFIPKGKHVYIPRQNRVCQRRMLFLVCKDL